VCDAHGRPAADKARGLRLWLERVAPARVRGTVTLALVSDARIRTLNREYRGKDYVTDVLSFPAEEGAASDVRIKQGRRVSPAHSWPLSGGGASRAAGQAGAHLGDVVIATGVAGRQARAAGHSLATELRVLALHGLLHLLGYDHERDDGEMARVERRLRRVGGLREGLIERAV
jgi:probable rRNA maturation factor